MFDNEHRRITVHLGRNCCTRKDDQGGTRFSAAHLVPCANVRGPRQPLSSQPLSLPPLNFLLGPLSLLLGCGATRLAQFPLSVAPPRAFTGSSS